MYEFGVGHMFANLKDGTSVEFGTLQDVSLDFSFDSKELYGRNQFPVKVARGKGKVEGKATYADIKANALNLVLNGSITAGQLMMAEPVNVTVPAATPYEVTVSVPPSGTLNSVLVVYDTSGDTKVPLKIVTTAPAAADEVQFDGTKLVFDASMTGKDVQYTYDYTTKEGKNIELVNNQMGTAPTFEVELNTQLDGKQIVLKLAACTTTKLSMNMKNEDFMIPDFSFSAFADSKDVIGKLYLDE